MLSMVRGRRQEQLDCSRPLRPVMGWPLIISPIRDQSLLLSRREGNVEIVNFVPSKIINIEELGNRTLSTVAVYHRHLRAYFQLYNIVKRWRGGVGMKLRILNLLLCYHTSFTCY